MVASKGMPEAPLQYIHVRAQARTQVLVQSARTHTHARMPTHACTGTHIEKDGRIAGGEVDAWPTHAREEREGGERRERRDRGERQSERA